jgi:hypothetical protein
MLLGHPYGEWIIAGFGFVIGLLWQILVMLDRILKAIERRPISN